MNKFAFWGTGAVLLIGLIVACFFIYQPIKPNFKTKKHNHSTKPIVLSSAKKTPSEKEISDQSVDPEYLKNIAQLLFQDGEAGEISAREVNQRMAALAELLKGANASNINQIVATFEASGITEDSSYDQLNELMKAWAHFDGPAALNYALTQMPEGIGGHSALAALRNWTDFNLEEGSQFYEQVPKSLRNEYVETMVSMEWKQEPEAALKWVESLTDPIMKNNAVLSLTDHWSREDGKQAAEWFSSNVAADKMGYAVVQVVGNWMKQDPENAMQWALSLPENKDTEAALAYGFNVWAGNDPARAGELLNQLPQSPKMDQAVYQYTLSVAPQEPKTAMGWAQSIHDPIKRTAIMTQVAVAWYKQDKEAALSWLEESNLPEIDRTVIINGGDVGFSE